MRGVVSPWLSMDTEESIIGFQPSTDMSVYAELNQPLMVKNTQLNNVKE